MKDFYNYLEKIEFKKLYKIINLCIFIEPAIN